VRQPNHLNDQLYQQEKDELGKNLVDLFSHLNINEQKESTQQTTKQVSHHNNGDKKKGTQRKKALINENKTTEQQKRKTTTCLNQTQEDWQELKGVRIQRYKTVTGDGGDRCAKRVNTWINRVQD
jgi:hypothetical protein